MECFRLFRSFTGKSKGTTVGRRGWISIERLGYNESYIWGTIVKALSFFVKITFRDIEGS